MGKAYRVPSSLDRLRKQQIQIKELQAINRSRNTPRPVASTAFAGVSAAGNTGGGTGNFLRPSGDTMIGVFALSPPVNFRVQIDADGIIDIGESSSNFQYSSNIQLDSIQPNTFVLDTIAGAAFDGQIIIIRTFAPSTPFTISQATLANGGNIQTPTDVDVTGIGDLQMVALMFDASLIVFDNAPGGTWRLLNTFGGGGGGGVSFPIDFPEDDRGTVGASTQDILFTASTRHSVKMIVSGDVDLAFSAPPTNETAYSNIIIVQDGSGGHTVTLPVGTINKDIVESGILLGIDEETGIVIKFAFGLFYAFLETGNIVSGGSAFSGNLSDLVIDISKDWDAQGVTNFGALSGVTALTMAGDIDVSTFDVLNIDRATFADDGSSIIANNIAQILLNISGSFQTNVDVGNDFVWTILNDTILTVKEDVSNNSVLTLQSLDDTGGAIMNLFRNDIDGGVPAGVVIGSYGFQTGTTVASNVAEYASIQSVAEVVVTGIFEGSMDFLAADGGGGQSTFISINNGANNLVDIFKVLGMNGNDILMGTGANIAAGGATEGMTNIGHLDFIDNTATPAAALSLYSDGIDLLANTGGGVVNLSNIGAVGANTTLSNLTSPTAINQILNMGTNSITFNPSTVLIGSPSATQLNIQFPTSTEELHLVFDTATTPISKWEFTSTALSGDNIILGNTLVINDSSTDPVADGIFSRNGSVLGLQIPTFQIQRATTGTNSGDLNLTKVDAAPSGGEPIYEINFNLFDSPTSITYSQIKGGIEDVPDAGTLEINVRADSVSNVNALLIEGSASTTNRTFVSLNSESRIGSDLAFQAPTGSTNLKIFPALNRLGIVVQDNTSFTVGTSGMLAIPIVNTIPAGAAGADTAFGNHIGAIGLFDNEVDDMAFFIRQLNGNWSQLFVGIYDALT